MVTTWSTADGGIVPGVTVTAQPDKFVCEVILKNGMPVLILGASGSEKNPRACEISNRTEIGIFNVAGKPLPFRKKLPLFNNAGYRD